MLVGHSSINHLIERNCLIQLIFKVDTKWYGILQDSMFLMEITDDKMVDNRPNPTDNCWEDAIADFFIDEDHTSEVHECSVEAFNVFAYHISAVPRYKNNYLNGSIVPFESENAFHHVIDLGNDFQ
jgi:hypothetical protein